MANYSTLISDITAKIYENAGNDITGQDLQDVLLEMVTEMGQSGMVCLGIADGNTNPPGSSDSNIFYIAGEGTYSNFGGLTVNAGEIALFIWDGLTWTKQSVTTTDPNKADKVAGATAGDLAGLNASGNLTDSGIPSNNVAQQDGYYSTLTAGTAENLVGRGTVLAEYTRRTSGGSADIGTGAATITKVHGNTIAWNQKVGNGDFSNGTSGWFAPTGGSITASDGVATIRAASTNGFARQNIVGGLLANHKYYWSGYIKADTTSVTFASRNTSASVNCFSAASSGNSTWERKSGVFTSTAAGNWEIRIIDGRSGGWTDYFAKDIFFVDLTLAFGSGNEPTASEFESLFPLNYYAYNTGSLVNLTATGINTVGFNQWDEEWELGTINSSGQDVANNTRIRSKGYTPVFPNTTYFFRSPTPLDLSETFCYDSDHNYLGHTSYTATGTGYLITTLPNTVYLRFNMKATYGTTYKNDICINLSWSGYRNGEYEAYWQRNLSLPITSVTSGGSAVFADGMKGVGSVYDELTSTKAVKRFGMIDLGTMNWSASGGGQFVAGDLVGTVKEPAYSSSPAANILCGKYTALGYTDYTSSDKCVMVMYATFSLHGYIYVKDTAYSSYTAAQFKTAMNGVYLVYELATPTEYTLDSELNLGYSVDDFGTEEEVPQNTSTPSTAPIIYDVKYAMNAVDTLRNLPTNYISKDSLKNLLDTMQSAGIFSAYTMTYNAGTEQYTFTITV